MSEQRDQIVRRVVHALEEHRDPDSLVRAYFDDDRDVVIEATRQTLEATREDAAAERVAAAVDRELIEALRFPRDEPGGALPTLWVHRGRVTIGAILVALASLLAVLLI